jgi:UDP:flavonoid glycosyltransferase YjiC (YdhE family)
MQQTTGARPLLLIFPFGLLSHYLRCLILCRELRAHFEVRIAANPVYKNFIDQEEVDTFECAAFNSAEVIEDVKRFDSSWLNSDLPQLIFSEQVKLIERLKPVAVLGDHSPTLKMAAEKTGVIFLSLINGYMSKHYNEHRAISRHHPAYKFIHWLPSDLRIAATKWGETKAFRALHKSFDKIRKKENLRPLRSYLDELEGDITMLCDLPELFPQHHLPREYHVVGPLFYDKDGTRTLQRLVTDPSKKTIVVSMGSSGEWQHAMFLNNETYNRFNVIAIGDHERVLDASHIIHINFGNVHILFPQADLIICHGGNGTIYQALLYNLPVLALTSHCEQEWNMHALEKNGLGYRLDGITDSVQLRSIIDHAIAAKTGTRSKEISYAIRKRGNELPGVIEKIAVAVKNKQPRLCIGENYSATVRKLQLTR